MESPECVYHPDLPENKKIFGNDNLEVCYFYADDSAFLTVILDL